MGFVACQRYLASTYGPHDITKNQALSFGPHHPSGMPFVQILNASANYWKHVDEWDLRTKVFRDTSSLNPQQRETIRIIELVTPWSDYTCANVLAALSAPSSPRFTAVIPILTAWRQKLADAAVATSVESPT